MSTEVETLFSPQNMACSSTEVDIVIKYIVQRKHMRYDNKGRLLAIVVRTYNFSVINIGLNPVHATLNGRSFNTTYK